MVVERQGMDGDENRVPVKEGMGRKTGSTEKLVAEEERRQDMDGTKGRDGTSGTETGQCVGQQAHLGMVRNGR